MSNDRHCWFRLSSLFYSLGKSFIHLTCAVGQSPSTAVPTVNNRSKLTSKINNVKKINTMFSVREYAVLLAGSSRTASHQSHINTLNLHGGSGQTLAWVFEPTLSSCLSGSELGQTAVDTESAIYKTTVTLNIQDTRMHDGQAEF